MLVSFFHAQWITDHWSRFGRKRRERVDFGSYKLSEVKSKSTATDGGCCRTQRASETAKRGVRSPGRLKHHLYHLHIHLISFQLTQGQRGRGHKRERREPPFSPSSTVHQAITKYQKLFISSLPFLSLEWSIISLDLDIERERERGREKDLMVLLTCHNSPCALIHFDAKKRRGEKSVTDG